MNTTLLEINDLQSEIFNKNSSTTVVNNVSLTVGQGETVAIVGESGSGKSMTALSILGLLPRPNGAITSGQIVFDAQNLTELGEQDLNRFRGSEISMIFQDPMTSLNPVFTIGNQLIEALRSHEKISKKEAWLRAVEALRDVHISDAESRMKQYPHELSGGMRQRIMIAMALITRPRLLIADEPTTALDVTVQAQILDLVKELRDKRNLAIVLVTHDLGVVADIADRVYVFYAGNVVESASVHDLFAKPQHPYTQGLLRSVPRGTDNRLQSIRGMVPDLTSIDRTRCAFADRCDFVQQHCLDTEPVLEAADIEHNVACHFYNNLKKRESNADTSA